VDLIERTASGVRLRLHVQPRASRSELGGRHGDAIKVRLTAPPVDGAANQALLRFLAAQLEVPLSALSLVAGASGRSKVVAVEAITPEIASRRLGLTDPCPTGHPG
jgi:uncharacterized protein (TIGR00251 family)